MKVLLAPLMLFSCLSLQALVNPSLKVDDYKNLNLLVENIDNNHLGLSKELIEKAVKLRLLSHGINPSGGGPFRSLYVYVKVTDIERASGWVGASVSHIEVGLSKFIKESEVSRKYGVGVKVGLQTRYVTSTDKERVLSVLKNLVDDFLLEYFEANLDRTLE